MTEHIEHEYIILGGGPAGLQMAWCLEGSGRDYLVLDGADGVGAFFESQPRHGTLISINKVYTGFDDAEINLRWDWNSLVGDDDGPMFRDFSTEYFPKREALVSLLRAYAEHHRLSIRTRTRVTRIAKVDGNFRLETDGGPTFGCRYLVVATGFTRENVPDIPGIEHAETYGTMPLDPKGFTNQRVCIIGKGNSAFETADHLVAHTACLHLFSPNPLKFAWDTHFVGHLRAVNNNIVDTYQLKAQNAVNRGNVVAIEPVDGKLQVSVEYTFAQGEAVTIPYDRVLCCTGWRFDRSIFDESCMPSMRHCGRLPAMDHHYRSPDVPGLYFAGTIMQSRDYHKTMSGFIHGFRHNIVALARIMDAHHHGTGALRTDRIAGTVEALSKRIIDRCNRSPEIFLQPGYLGEALVFAPDGAVDHYSGLPVDYLHADLDVEQRTWLTVTLEYGKVKIDPFADERVTDMDRVDETFYLHPIIRRYVGREVVDEHHIPEDLENRFDNPAYTRPLEAWLEKVVAEARAGLVAEGPRDTLHA